jgi:STE24 endopeptidase
MKMRSTLRSLLFGLFLSLCLSSAAVAAAAVPVNTAAGTTTMGRDFPPGLQIPDAARPGMAFDVDKATESYLNLLSPEQRRLSDAYFEGGYWLQLWGFLYGTAIGVLLLVSGVSVRMRDFSQRMFKARWLSTGTYGLLWVLAGFVLGLPLSYYTDFLREHQYGLSTQDFGGWMGDTLKSLMVAVIVTPLLISGLYALVRRLGARWWTWAAVSAGVLNLFFGMVFPVFVAPLFNDYKPLPNGPVRSAVLSLARANRIPTDHVEWFDASKQTTRVSANVSGFIGTTRVNLNDNLVNKTSLPEIKAVLGHEMGHYVLNHTLRLVIYQALLIALGLYLTHRAFDWSLARWGARLGLQGREDPAALPLAVIWLSTFYLLATPIGNSITRQAEAEADAFGLNAAREPNGFAMSAMRLSTYRKLRPGPLEEIVFYDHPSGYTRVHNSMLWLAENQDNPTANARPAAVLPSAMPVAPAPAQPSSTQAPIRAAAH